MDKLRRVARLSIVVGVVSLCPAIVTPQAASAESISPTTAVGQAPQNYGIVRSAGLNTLEIRHLSGGYRTYSVSSDLTASMALSPGDFVAYNADASGTLTQLQPPRIARIFEGTISNIQGNQITVVAPDGSSLTTTVAANSINRLELSPGKGLSVTQYEGLSATKVCCISKFTQQPPVLLPPEPAAAPPQPIPALW